MRESYFNNAIDREILQDAGRVTTEIDFTSLENVNEVIEIHNQPSKRLRG